MEDTQIINFEDAAKRKELVNSLIENQSRGLAESERAAAAVKERKLSLQKILGTLKNFDKIKDEEMLLPVGEGFFLRVKVVPGSKFLVDLNNGILVDKDAKEATEKMESILEGLTKMEEKAQFDIEHRIKIGRQLFMNLQKMKAEE